MSGIIEPAIQRWLATPFREAHPDAVEHIRDLLHATQSHGCVGTCLAIKALDTHNALTRVACPTLVMTGDQDTGVPMEAAREIATHIPDARLEAIPHTVHLAPIEQEEGFLADLNKFLGHVGCGSQRDMP